MPDNTPRQSLDRIRKEIESCLYKNFKQKYNNHFVVQGLSSRLTTCIERNASLGKTNTQSQAEQDISSLFDFIHDIYSTPAARIFKSPRPPNPPGNEKDKKKLVECLVEKSVAPRLLAIKSR